VLPTLRDGDLVLRPLEGDDLEVLMPLVEEPTVSAWWGSDRDPGHLRDGFVNDGSAFAVELDGTLAGWLGFEEERDVDYRYVAFDIMLDPGHQGRGLGPRVLRLAIGWFAAERGHHRFTIDPAVENERAIAAYSKAGFRPVGVLRRADRAPDGSWRDALLMDLLAEELD
jgi:aminoglycoside 6'-N-acetyltransferase